MKKLNSMFEAIDRKSPAVWLKLEREIVINKIIRSILFHGAYTLESKN
jgi:hypothetical protein